MSSDDPIARFLDARSRAVAAGARLDGAAAVLATATPDGAPSVRWVLVKEAGEEGFFVYTSYESRKAAELEANPRAALAMHWPEIGEQFRVEGPVRRAPAAVSDAYFASRPRESQLGAWASPQSQPIASRAVLLERVRELEARFRDGPVPRPPSWGGYVVSPLRIEHWIEGAGRLHDRAVFERDAGGWKMHRLAP
ncbi:MAG: pyridoxamine 5'-phosphate oxidase [Sandaracinaceae bacterium]|nr:pyridoxamine 5'-phosphate oxidase [Sandaracinaceae bacterium]